MVLWVAEYEVDCGRRLWLLFDEFRKHYGRGRLLDKDGPIEVGFN